MPKEYYGETLKEIKIIGNCIRMNIDNKQNSYDNTTYPTIYNIKKEHLVGIIKDIDGTTFLFKDMLIKIRQTYKCGEQLASIIKSELEGVVQSSTDLLGINT